MTLLDYLHDTSPKLVIGGFFLKLYPKDKYLFNSYKVSLKFSSNNLTRSILSFRSYPVLKMCMLM